MICRKIPHFFKSFLSVCFVHMWFQFVCLLYFLLLLRWWQVCCRLAKQEPRYDRVPAEQGHSVAPAGACSSAARVAGRCFADWLNGAPL